MKGYHDFAEPLARLIEKFGKGKDFVHAGRKTISNSMMVSKWITLLAQTAMFNKDTKERGRQTTDLKTCANYKTFFH